MGSCSDTRLLRLRCPPGHPWLDRWETRRTRCCLRMAGDKGIAVCSDKRTRAEMAD